METTQTTKPNKFKVFCNSIYAGLKQDVKTKNSDFNRIMLKCGILAFLLMCSLFWAPLVYVVLFFALLFAGTQMNGRALYFIIFLAPLMQIFKYDIKDYYHLIYVSAFVILVLGIKLLIDIIRKKKKIEWFFTISFAVYALYISSPFQYFGLRYWGSLMLGVLILFLAYYYRKDINLKEMVFVYTLGIILTAFFGVFTDISRLNTLVSKFPEHGFLRFTGASTNPNVIMGETIFCIGMLIYLFLNNKINYLFYPLLMICTVVVILTMSKVGLMTLAIVYGLFLCFLFFRKINKTNTIKTVISVLVICLSFLVCFRTTLGTFGRLTSAFDEEKNEAILNQEETETVLPYEYEDIVVEIFGKTINLTEFTTGRFDIWTSYISKTFETFKSAMFGYGVGAPFIGEWRGWDKWQPHNTFIQCLYYTGLVGISLMIVWFISTIKKGDLKKFNWYSLVPLVGLFLYLCDLEFFSFRLAIYLLMLIPAFKKEDEEYRVQTLEEPVIIIPKKIHYIWLGGKPLPEIAKKCIATWQKHCPDYEIKQWDESNLNIDICPYCRQAYDAKKFAFASDVLRFDVINREGGVYLDIDVELYSSLDKFLGNQFFTAFESDIMVNPGLIMGAEKGNKHIKNILDSYKKDNFINEDGSLNTQNTVCVRTTKYLEDCGIKMDNSLQKTEEITVYPTDYFCPKSPITNQINKTENTVAMHLYYASWISTKAKIKKAIKYVLNFFTNGYFGIILSKIKG